jgi:hypothetical protein
MGGEVEGGLDRPVNGLRPHQYISRLLVLGLLISLFVFGACSSGRRGGAETLEERVKGFWQARVAGNDLQAYNYEAYVKTGKMTLQQYIQARSPALKYVAYKVKKIEENGDEATVTVDFTYHLVIPARMDLDLPTTVDERWVRIDGQWYRQVEQPDANHASG